MRGPAPERAVPVSRQRPALPGWLTAVLAMAGIGVLLAAVYWFVQTRRGTTAEKAAAPAAQAEQTAAAPAAAPQGEHPLAKHIELTGWRVLEDKGQRLLLKFLAVNHSAADLPELKLHVDINREKDTVADFPVTLPAMGPFESRELTVRVPTKLRAYELPDWQFIKPVFSIESPR